MAGDRDGAAVRREGCQHAAADAQKVRPGLCTRRSLWCDLFRALITAPTQSVASVELAFLRPCDPCPPAWSALGIGAHHEYTAELRPNTARWATAAAAPLPPARPPAHGACKQGDLGLLLLLPGTGAVVSRRHGRRLCARRCRRAQDQGRPLDCLPLFPRLCRLHVGLGGRLQSAGLLQKIARTRGASAGGDATPQFRGVHGSNPALRGTALPPPTSTPHCRCCAQRPCSSTLPTSCRPSHCSSCRPSLTGRWRPAWVCGQHPLADACSVQVPPLQQGSRTCAAAEEGWSGSMGRPEYRLSATPVLAGTRLSPRVSQHALTGWRPALSRPPCRRGQDHPGAPPAGPAGLWRRHCLVPLHAGEHLVGGNRAAESAGCWPAGEGTRPCNRLASLGTSPQRAATGLILIQKIMQNVYALFMSRKT